MSHITAANPQELNEWLLSRGVDTRLWGIGRAKSVDDLWLEITEGESALLDDPPLRVIDVVHLIIRDTDRFLIEERQELRNGHQRHRGTLPSEKIKPGEGHLDAALRGLREELQVHPDSVEVLRVSSQPKTQTRKSVSYPGLSTEYSVHTVEVRVEGLPRQRFCTSETAHGTSDPVTKHHWRWASASEEELPRFVETVYADRD